MIRSLNVATLSLALAAACAHLPERETVLTVGEWPELPAVVLASSELDDCQRAAVYAAASWWNERAGVVVLDVHDVAAGALAVNGLPPQGVIGVSLAPLSAPEVFAETTVHTLRGRIHSADLRIRVCSVQAYAHELGHALGLADTQGTARLMSVTHGADSWLVTDGEIAHVRGGPL